MKQSSDVVKQWLWMNRCHLQIQSYTSWLINGLVTWSPWNGGMTFGSTNHSQLICHILWWHRHQNLTNTKKLGLTSWVVNSRELMQISSIQLILLSITSNLFLKLNQCLMVFHMERVRLSWSKQIRCSAKRTSRMLFTSISKSTSGPTLNLLTLFGPFKRRMIPRMIQAWAKNSNSTNFAINGLRVAE